MMFKVMSRASLKHIAFITFPRGTGSRDDRVRLFSESTQTFEQGSPTVSPRISASTRIILAWN